MAERICKTWIEVLIKGVRYRRQQHFSSPLHCYNLRQAATKFNSFKTLQLLKVERKLFYLGFTHTTTENDVISIEIPFMWQIATKYSYVQSVRIHIYDWCGDITHLFLEL